VSTNGQLPYTGEGVTDRKKGGGNPFNVSWGKPVARVGPRKKIKGTNPDLEVPNPQRGMGKGQVLMSRKKKKGEGGKLKRSKTNIP